MADKLNAAIRIKDFVKENRKRLSQIISSSISDQEDARIMAIRLDEIPEPFLCRPLEIDLLLDEVRRGGLEWLYQEKIGETTLGEIAKTSGHRLLQEKDAQMLEALQPPSRFWRVSVLRTRYY